MIRAFLLATALLAASFSGAGAASSDTPLPEKVVAMLRAANIGEAHLGVHAIRVADGAVVLSHRPHQSMQPASTIKVLTAIAGLEQLGPTYRGRTELRSAAKLTDGVLEGDLVLRGMGDPDLDWESLQRMLQTPGSTAVRRDAGVSLQRHSRCADA
jgi:serine-type D-Ala-D-Ala carboxypeptidase/endopeptidase (penicillin-binding protein 4)